MSHHPPSREIKNIEINSESYIPTPHEVNPELPQDYVWSSPWPPNNAWLDDPAWYDALGQDQITQRRIWAAPSEDEQIAHFRQLLVEFPTRARNMLFAAAVKGKLGVVKFLSEQRVRVLVDVEEGDDETVVPVHAAAYQGHLECVKYFVGELGIGPDVIDDLGGTPLCRACWGKRVDVVRYLIEKGGDPFLRQMKPEDGEEGASAFSFAVGSGCLNCVRIIVEYAEKHGIEIKDKVTATVVAAAANSNDLDVLQLILELRHFPQVKNAQYAPGSVISLNAAQKEAIEYAIQMAISASAFLSLPTMLNYLSSIGSNGVLNFPSLSREVSDSLLNGLWHSVDVASSRNISERHFGWQSISRFLFLENPGNADIEIAEAKDGMVGDAFVRAAGFREIETLKVIKQTFGNHDVNHLTKEPPQMISALYAAAGSGYLDVLDYLHETYGTQLDGHVGHGKFANGPSSLCIAIWAGQKDAVKWLMEKQLAPIDVFAQLKSERQPGRRIVISAEKRIKAATVIWPEQEFRELHDSDEQEEFSVGKASHKDGSKVRYVRLDSDEDDVDWIGRLETRKSDRELQVSDKRRRPLKGADPVDRPGDQKDA